MILRSTISKHPLNVRKPYAMQGFSLVELVIALGVVSFALISLVGLLPVGLQTFRQSMDNTVTAQIVQRVVNESQQTDFDTLANGVYYFNDQGGLVQSTDSMRLYDVNLTVHKGTSIPSGTSALTSSDLAILTIQITQTFTHAARTESALVARSTQ